MLSFELSEDQAALVEEARRFTREKIIPVAAQCDRTHEYPMDVFREAWELGLVGADLPESYGGGGLSTLDAVLLVEELAYGCTGIQTSMTANSLAATPVILAGSDEQQRRYLGMLASEPCFASYALTESGAGSDAAAIVTRAEERGDEWILSGSKVFITNASFARWYIVFATVDTQLRHKGIAAFIVDRDLPGVSIGKREDKLGQRASDTSVVNFDEVHVPKSDLLAPPGQGFQLAMRTFDRTRPAIGAAAAGLIRRALDESVAYANERKTFGKAIAEHQMVQALLADMAISYQATRLLTHKAAWEIDAGVERSITSSCSKAFGGDAAMRCATDAVQIFGGNGYMTEYPVEKLMRDAKILQIYEGTSQIQRLVIARNLVAGVR